jgi:cytochrome b involved in lipid metabolism
MNMLRYLRKVDPLKSVFRVRSNFYGGAVATNFSHGYESASGKFSAINVSLAFSALVGTICVVGTADADTNDKLPVYRQSEVAKHNTPATGIWVTYKDGVYDVSEFVANHPGGKDRLMLAAGKNLSDFWRQPEFRQHYKSPLAHELLDEMRIGSLHPNDVRPDNFSTAFAKNELQYSNKHIYDCIVVGSGVSGLQCAVDLTKKHGLKKEDVLVLEAQDYVGGRVRQVDGFIKGVHIDVGAEFLHGNGTRLTKFAEENNEPIREIYCWAHGDGGPLPEPVGQGYGLYWIGDKLGNKRLLRYDAPDNDFKSMNEALWELAELDENKYSDSHSLHDYLAAKGFSPEMMMMAHGGFSNTLCTNSKDLSLKQCIKWSRLWHSEEGEDGDL